MNNIKGPWSVADKIWIEDSEGYLVASVSIKYGDKANLIASAPELLEAVQALVDWSEEQTKLSFYDRMMQFNAALDKASAAIAKAKGEV